MDHKTAKELIFAYKILFPEEYRLSLDHISSLKLSKLKSVYRKKALETHPDRAFLLGLNEDTLSHRFKELTLSYHNLYSFLDNNPRQIIILPERHPVVDKKKDFDHNPGPRVKEFLKADQISKDRLLFGQLLFDSGLISISTLLNALQWQRQQRPRYGEIARQWDILSTDEIIKILRTVKFKEKFGEGALRLGYLNPFQHKAIMFKQRNLQSPIGEYFLSRGFINAEELKIILEQQRYYYRGTK